MAIDAKSRSASQFAATASAPFADPVNGRRAILDATFAYRRGGATVMATLAARDADSGAALDLPGAGAYLVFYPQGAQFRTGRIAAETPGRFVRVAARLLQAEAGRRQRVASFIADADAPDAPHPAPVELRPMAADGGAALFDEACPPRPVTARVAADAGGSSDSKVPVSVAWASVWTRRIDVDRRRARRSHRRRVLSTSSAKI